MEYWNFPPEIRCRIYQQITNYADIENLLSIYNNDDDDDEESSERELIYRCIDRIENVMTHGFYYLHLDYISKFPYLKKVEAPIYLSTFDDIMRIKNLRFLTKATFLNGYNIPLEQTIYHILKIIPDNLRLVYFTDLDPPILYHYNRDTKFLGIASDNVESVIINTTINDIISYFPLHELYLDIPSDSSYPEIITAAINAHGPNILISSTKYNVSLILPIAHNVLIRQDFGPNHFPLFLGDMIVRVYPNIRRLHGGFTMNSFLHVQNLLPNVQSIGVYIPNDPYAGIDDISNMLSLVNRNIREIHFYTENQMIPLITRYITRYSGELKMSVGSITEIRNISDEMYIDAYLIADY